MRGTLRVKNVVWHSVVKLELENDAVNTDSAFEQGWLNDIRRRIKMRSSEIVTDDLSRDAHIDREYSAFSSRNFQAFDSSDISVQSAIGRPSKESALRIARPISKLIAAFETESSAMVDIEKRGYFNDTISRLSAVIPTLNLPRGAL
jgi:hypothetical protein